jgi:hypothetical protein
MAQTQYNINIQKMNLFNGFIGGHNVNIQRPPMQRVSFFR